MQCKATVTMVDKFFKTFKTRKIEQGRYLSIKAHRGFIQ
jgi:hypothetical protein